MRLDVTYSAGVSADFEMPSRYTWDNVRDWWVKWDVLYLTMDDNTEHKIILPELMEAEIDSKYPDVAEIVNDGGVSLDSRP